LPYPKGDGGKGNLEGRGVKGRQLTPPPLPFGVGGVAAYHIWAGNLEG